MRKKERKIYLEELALLPIADQRLVHGQRALTVHTILGLEHATVRVRVRIRARIRVRVRVRVTPLHQVVEGTG